MPEAVTQVVAVLALLLSAATAYRQFIYRRSRVIASFLDFRMGTRDASALAFTAEIAFSNQGDLPAAVSEVKLLIRYPEAEGHLPITAAGLLSGEQIRGLSLAPGELRHAELVFPLTQLQLKNLLGERDERNAEAQIAFAAIDDRGRKRTRQLHGLSVTIDATSITGTTNPLPTQLQLLP